MSPILYLPSQVMTSEQAVSRVQDLIDNYRRHTEVPSSTLPTAMRLIIRQAFEELAHWTMRIEIYLPQLPMFFPDDITPLTQFPGRPRSRTTRPTCASLPHSGRRSIYPIQVTNLFHDNILDAAAS